MSENNEPEFDEEEFERYFGGRASDNSMQKPLCIPEEDLDEVTHGVSREAHTATDHYYLTTQFQENQLWNFDPSQRVIENREYYFANPDCPEKLVLMHDRGVSETLFACIPILKNVRNLCNQAYDLGLGRKLKLQVKPILDSDEKTPIGFSISVFHNPSVIASLPRGHIR